MSKSELIIFPQNLFSLHSSLLINHTAIYPVIHARNLVWQYEIVWLQNGKTTGFCKRRFITCLRIISWKAFVRIIISSQIVSFLKLCISHLSFFFLFLLSSVSSLCELDFSDNIWLTKTPVLLPGKSHGQRSLVGCSPWACEELDTTKQLHSHFSFSCIGEGNGNPLQCSCLENPRDGEPSGLPSLGSHRVGHDWSYLAEAAAWPFRPSLHQHFSNVAVHTRRDSDCPNLTDSNGTNMSCLCPLP